MDIVERLRHGIAYLPRTAPEGSPDAAAFVKLGDAIFVNEGDFWSAIMAMPEAADTIVSLRRERDEALAKAGEWEAAKRKLEAEHYEMPWSVNQAAQERMKRESAEAEVARLREALRKALLWTDEVYDVGERRAEAETALETKP